VGVKSV